MPLVPVVQAPIFLYTASRRIKILLSRNNPHLRIAENIPITGGITNNSLEYFKLSFAILAVQPF